MKTSIPSLVSFANMMLRNFFMFCLIFLFFLGAKLQACGESEYEEASYGMILPEELSFFPSKFSQNPLYKDFIFQTHPQTELGAREEETNQDKRHEKDDKDFNVEEWAEFLNISKKDIEKMTGMIYSKLLPIPLPLKIPEKALEYLVFSKKCEKFADDSPDEWEDAQAKQNISEMMNLIAEGLKNYKKLIESDTFLKLRYGFQIVRLARYAKKYDLAVTYYNQLIPHLKSSSIYVNHALRHKSGALLKQGKIDEFLVVSAAIFDRSPLFMHRILFSDFFIPEPDIWNKALESLKGETHRKATLWTMRLLFEKKRIDLLPLKEIYQLEPKEQRTELLLIRQINRLEQNFLTADIFVQPELLTKNSYLLDMNQFLESVNFKIVKNPALWYLALAYTDILVQKYSEALVALTHAQESNPLLKNEVEFFRLLAEVIHLKPKDQIPLSLEEKFVPIMAFLQEQKRAFNGTAISYSLFFALTKKYLQTGQFDRAYFCLSKADFPNLLYKFVARHSDPSDLQQVIDLYLKPNKTEFEKIITNNIIFTLDDLYYMKATKHLINEEFDLAFEMAEKMSNEMKNKKEISTSFEKVVYNHKSGLYGEGKKKFSLYSKYEFIKNLHEINAKAKEQKDPAIYHIQMANAFFHTPFWRYYHTPILPSNNHTPLIWNRPSFEYSRNDPLSDVAEKNKFIILGRDYLTNEEASRYIAWKFYDQAASEAQDRELAALSNYMAAASQKKFSYFNEPAKDVNFDKKTVPFYFEVLKNKYSDTKFYKQIIKECASLKNYLSKKK